MPRVEPQTLHRGNVAKSWFLPTEIGKGVAGGKPGRFQKHSATQFTTVRFFVPIATN